MKQESFQEDIAAAQKMLEKFEASQVRAAEEVRSSLGASIEEHQESVDQLREVKRQVQAKAKSGVARKGEVERELAAVEEELAAAQAALEEVVAAEAEYASNVAVEKENVLQMSMAVAEAEVSSVSRSDELEKAVGWYKARLGFRFEACSGGGLRFIFTSIDQFNHDREYFFTLRVSSSNEYVLSECVPPVDGVSPLLDVLNESNNLSGFIVGMRKKFRASV